jgi:hypothetical protein
VPDDGQGSTSPDGRRGGDRGDLNPRVLCRKRTEAADQAVAEGQGAWAQSRVCQCQPTMTATLQHEAPALSTAPSTEHARPIFDRIRAVMHHFRGGSGANSLKNDNLPRERRTLPPLHYADRTAFQTAGVRLSLRRNLPRLNCPLPIRRSSSIPVMTIVSEALMPFFHDPPDGVELPQGRGGFELSLCLTLMMTRRVNSDGSRF